jgi:predicted ATPase/DNA-binding CsgD family transcriptional regulator
MPGDRLPQPLTSFLGRADDVTAIGRAVRQYRLVTLTGPGGVGKTRLAIESARAEAAGFREGARFVDLAPVRDGEAVAGAVLAGLGGPEPRGPALTALIGLAADQELLIVLDNCEQVIEAVAETVEQLLQGSAGVVVLATSREPLGIPGEVTWRVPPLELPAGAETLPLREARQLPAVRLFAERARLAVPAFELSEQDVPAVVRICRAVDCLPLALELAAARVRALPVAHLAERLGERLPMLSGGARTAPERQRTMEAAVRWSHDLLAEGEKALFRRLAVFTGGWTLEAAEGVCGFGELSEAGVLPLLESLVDRSLVVATPERGRFRFLEVIREFALNELERSGEAIAQRGRHCRWFRELTEQALPHLDGPSARYWLDLLEAEIENLRTALAWALEDEASRGDGLLLAGNAMWLWNGRGYLAEAYDVSRRLLAAGPSPPTARLQALKTVIFGANHALDGWSGEHAALEAAEIARELGDEWSLAHVLAIGAASRIYRADRDLAGAREWAREAIEAGERSGNFADAGRGLWALDIVEQAEGAVADAPPRHLSAATTMAARSGSPHLQAMVHISLGEIARSKGELGEAVQCYERAQAIARALGIQRMLGLVQVNLALTAVEARDWPRALAGLRAVCAADGALEPNVARAVVLCAAAVEAARGAAATAARWLAFFDEERAFAVDTADVPVLDRALQECRERLGSEFGDAYAQGLGLDVADLVREVRAWLDEQAPDVAAPVDRPAGLSPREVEILRLVAGGESNQAIADRLVLSRRTVENHIANVYSKIGAANRVEATRFALDHDLLPGALA